jgi:hypothetical protein
MVRRIDCRNVDQDIPCADDAIPKGSISLFDAFWRLLALMDGDRLERALCAGGADPEALVERRHIPDDARSDWELLLETRRRTSNLTLRWALETAELVACVRDPETGDVLQLDSEGWVDWDDDIPALVTSNFIIPGEYDSIGPSGTFIRGALRPVFFVREEFETWLNGFFGDLSPTPGSSSLPATISRPPRAHRLEATKQAILAMWGRNGPPAGLPEDMREQKISEWLKANGLVRTSKSTIGRALSVLSSSR